MRCSTWRGTKIRAGAWCCWMQFSKLRAWRIGCCRCCGPPRPRRATGGNHMTWANVYLVCFLVGFTLSLLSVLAGAWHVHLPHLDHHGLHFHVGHGGHAGGGRSGASIINFGTIAAFLAWFGGTGYLLTEYSSLWFLLALGVAVAVG